MPQAQITINAVAGSDDDLPIDTLVQLNNDNIGGEVTFQWTILDQPEGAADTLSSTSIVNPTFTPRKEGTYLIELIVNLGLPSEQRDRVVAAVRHLKTRDRIPAAGEADENGASGWAKANGVNALLLRLIDMKADPGIVVGLINEALMAYGDTCVAEGTALIKTGLPGEERLAQFGFIAATAADVVRLPIAMPIAAVEGGSLSSGKLAYFRIFGLLQSVPVTGASAGDPVYVSDAINLTITPGTNTRCVGRVLRVVSAGVADVWFNGLGGEN